MIRQLLAADGSHQPTPSTVLATLDLVWLRDEYEGKHRSIKDIAAELGVSSVDLAAHARTHGFTPRHGIASRAHVLASHGGPTAFSPQVWATFTRPGAEQRVCRFLAIPGHPSTKDAAKHLGVRKDLLARQVRILEHDVGAALLRAGPASIVLTEAGRQFAREAGLVLDLLQPVAPTTRVTATS